MTLRRESLIAAGCVLAAVMGDDVRRARAQDPPELYDIYTWGRGNAGQLGPPRANVTIPSPLGHADTWVAIAAGSEHTIALNEAGEVWAWGSNADGQLGDGTTTLSMMPVRVLGLTDVEEIAAGNNHNLARRRSDDSVWAWGSNLNGQLGHPGIAGSSVPVQVLGSFEIASVAADGSHSVAVTKDGVLLAWGSNRFGQLGLGDFVDRESPEAVPGLVDVVTAGAGEGHTLAVTGAEGQVWSFGWNVFGQLGNGTQGTPGVGSPTPFPLPGLTDIVAVDGGDFHSVAIQQDGSVWTWGYNTEGQVGNGEVTPANTGVLSPTHLAVPLGVTQIDAGGIHTIALTESGDVWVWGSNQFGGCGNNSRHDELVPVRARVNHAYAVAAGGGHSLALARAAPTRRVVVLGDARGEFPPPDLVEVPTAEVSGLSSVRGLSAGLHHSLALTEDGRVYAWGGNDKRQLGRSGARSDDPSEVVLPLAPSQRFVQVAAGGEFGVALRSDGAVFAWGDNTYGQVGTGSTASFRAPERVEGLQNITSIAAGDRHALALARQGVFAWGDNEGGQLGAPASATPQRTPARMSGISSPIAIAAGGFHSMALDIVGGVLVWGSNFKGQLGRNRALDSHRPERAHLPAQATAIAGGRYHSLAVTSGGELWAFGDNASCQRGDGSFFAYWTPVRVALDRPITTAVAGYYHSYAVDYEGAVFAWGDDTLGQLGVLSPARRVCTPVAVSIGSPTRTLLTAGHTHSVAASW